MYGWKFGKSGKVVSTAFRTRLQLTIMMIVGVVTAGTLYFAQQKSQQDNEQNLTMQFQARTGLLMSIQEMRQSVVAERCRALAHSVRIRAALEEQDNDDLYRNAEVELRDILARERPHGRSAESYLPYADFVRFLNAQGNVLLPGEAGVKLQPWEQELSAAGASPEQQIGYVKYPATEGGSTLEEVIATNIVDVEGEPLGTLVLGFPLSDFSRQSDAGLKTGIWLDHQLHMTGIAENDRPALTDAIKATLDAAPEKSSNLTVSLQGEPNLMFYKALNPHSRFPVAYVLCFYPLTDALAKQHWLRIEILVAAGVLLIGGLLASHFISANFSRPVQELAEHSAENMARREMAEAALVVTEQKYQSIFENALEGIFVLSPEGRYLNANPALARIFGFASATELMASLTDPAQQLYAEPARHGEMLRQAQREGMVADAEAEMWRQDGSIIWTSQSVRAIYADGDLLHFEGTLEDITERKRAADATQALNADLEKALAELKTTQNHMIQQERLRALGQMASGIAHDFNNALMPVLGFAELLVAKPALLNDQPKALRYLETIRTAAKDATSIVARLREFYRSNEGGEAFKPVDLRKLAGQSITLTQPKWKGQAQSRGAEIRIEEKLAEIPLVAGDESALREVLTNLIFNAVDAMPKGGTITLTTRRDEGHAILEVGDTGTGMTEEVRTRCLEPFFSTKGEGGTGLGLAMVFGIVQRHGGEVDIRTGVGQGTTFVLRFPQALETVEVEEHDHGDRTLQGLNVLVVDDEPQIREVLTAYLETDGHTVRTAGDGTNGLRQFLDEKFDLVIADKAMPGMSGDQMAEAIRHFSPRMPVVLLSGFNTDGEDEHLEGVSVITAKPVTLSGLRESIEKAMQNP